MTSADLITKLLTTPGLVWPLFILLFSIWALGLYAGWSAKFIIEHRHMIHREEFDDHSDRVAESLERLNKNLENFKAQVFDVLIARNERG